MNEKYEPPKYFMRSEKEIGHAIQTFAFLGFLVGFLMGAATMALFYLNHWVPIK